MQGDYFLMDRNAINGWTKCASLLIASCFQENYVMQYIADAFDSWPNPDRTEYACGLAIDEGVS